jgi:hypothetical protein
MEAPEIRKMIATPARAGIRDGAGNPAEIVE